MIILVVRVLSALFPILLADVNKRLEDKELEIRLTDAAKNYVIDHGYLYNNR